MWRRGKIGRPGPDATVQWECNEDRKPYDASEHREEETDGVSSLSRHKASSS
jgi:hypothetical protein